LKKKFERKKFKMKIIADLQRDDFELKLEFEAGIIMVV